MKPEVYFPGLVRNPNEGTFAFSGYVILHRNLSMAILGKIKSMSSPTSCSDSGQQQMLREKFKNIGDIQDCISRIFSQFLLFCNLRISWTRSCVFVFNTLSCIFIPWMHTVAFEIQQLILEPKIMSKMTWGGRWVTKPCPYTCN